MSALDRFETVSGTPYIDTSHQNKQSTKNRYDNKYYDKNVQRESFRKSTKLILKSITHVYVNLSIHTKLVQQMKTDKKLKIHIWNTIIILTSSVAAGFSRHNMLPSASNPDFRPFGLETGMWVAPKVGNLLPKFGHTRPLCSRIIRFVRNWWMDRQKQCLLRPSLRSGGIINNLNIECKTTYHTSCIE